MVGRAGFWRDSKKPILLTEKIMKSHDRYRAKGTCHTRKLISGVGFLEPPLFIRSLGVHLFE